MAFDRAPVAGTLNTSRGRGKPSAFDAWAEAALAGITPAAPADGGWTPKIVGEQLVDALKWARHAAGRVGPAGFVGMRMPETFLSDDEHAAMGWGFKETADDPDDIPPMRITPTPAQISRHLAALEWPAVYLVGEGKQGSARMVGLWAACKAYRRPFDKAVKARGLSRGAAYALRDRGLSMISVGLAVEGVPVELDV